MADHLDPDCAMFWTTNHDKAAVHGLVSQPITAYIKTPQKSTYMVKNAARLEIERYPDTVSFHYKPLKMTWV